MVGLMELQPPPDAPAPVPSVAEVRSHARYRAIWTGGLVCLVGMVLVFIILPQIVGKSRARSSRIFATSQAIGDVRAALIRFETEYGRFPDATTIPAVQRDSGTTMPLGTASSNDFYRQLVVLGLIKKSQFQLGIPKGLTYSSGVLPLGKGECGFAYVPGLILTDSPRMPVMIAPDIPGTNRLDRERLGGKAAILWTDGSMDHYAILRNGKISTGGGGTIDPAVPMWEDKPLPIVWPE